MSGCLTRHASPPNWPARRALALARDAPQWACAGACGDPPPAPGRGGAPNQQQIVRDPTHAARWGLLEDAPRGLCGVMVCTTIRVVLTTAPLCQASRCSDLAHLRLRGPRCPRRRDRGP